MSKGNMLLGLARGSVGDVTFYRRNAQQITRVRVRNVKNPKSPAQMGQRAIQRTAVQAYSVLKSICDHSFEGVSYGANSYSKFLSLNMDMLRYEASNASSAGSNKSFVPSGFQGLAMMPFIISKGSLHSIGTLHSGDEFLGIELIETGSLAPANITYQDVINLLGAQQGDQVTIIRIPEPTTWGFPDEPLGRNMILTRFILDPGHGNDPAETAFFTIRQGEDTMTINDPNPRNEGRALFVRVNDKIVVTAGNNAKDNVFHDDDYAFCAILSRQNADGSWLRSDSKLLFFENYREAGYTLKQASTLEPVDVYIENDYYLNNAE